MSNDLELILERLQQHFTPQELVEFLGLEWHHLLDNEPILDVIIERMDDIKEEVGVE